MSPKHKNLTAELSPAHMGESGKSVLVITFVILVVIAGLATFVAINQSQEQENVVLPCSSDAQGSLLRRAASALLPNDATKIPELASVVEEIKSKADYEQDINCLYPIVVYHILITDRENAQAYFEKLEPIYDEPQLSPWYQYRLTAEEMREHINHLAAVEKEAADNAILIEVPEDLE